MAVRRTYALFFSSPRRQAHLSDGLIVAGDDEGDLRTNRKTVVLNAIITQAAARADEFGFIGDPVNFLAAKRADSKDALPGVDLNCGQHNLTGRFTRS